MALKWVNPITGQADYYESGGGTPGGSDGTPQYNNGGALGGIEQIIVCDVLTDTGINDAIDALGAAGGTVQLIPGTYVIDGAITIDYAKTTIKGSGWDTILDASGWTQDAHAINMNSKQYTILKDFKIVGKAGGAAAYDLINSGAINDFIIDHLWVDSADRYGVNITSNYSDNNKIINSQFMSCDNGGVELNNCRWFVINNNIFQSNSGFGLHIYSGLYGVVSNNKLYGNSSSDAAMYFEYGENISVTDNTSNSNGGGAFMIKIVSGKYFYITGNRSIYDYSGLISFWSPVKSIISGNHSINCQGGSAAEILINNYFNTTSGLTISDNSVETGWNPLAIKIDGSSYPCDDITIENNILSTSGKGIEITSGNTNIVVSNNTFGSTITVPITDAGTGTRFFETGIGLELPHIISKVASATARNSHDAEATSTSATYVKAKTITLNCGLVGQQRFVFDVKTSNALNPSYVRIYKNGVALGTEKISIVVLYETVSEDLTQTWLPGDKCELWIHNDGTETVSVRNFRIEYDDSPTVAVESVNS